MCMLKCFLIFYLLLLPISSAQADDYPYLAFEAADGKVRPVGVEGLRITFDGAVLQAINDAGHYDWQVVSIVRRKTETEKIVIR